MYKFKIFAIVLVCGLVCSVKAQEAEQKGTLHKTLTKLNSVAEKVPGVVKSVNNNIEVSVENMMNPEPQKYGMVRSSVRAAGQLVGSVSRDVAGFGKNVIIAASDLGSSTTRAIRHTLKRSLNRLLGRKTTPTVAPPSVQSSAAAETKTLPEITIETTVPS